MIATKKAEVQTRVNAPNLVPVHLIHVANALPITQAVNNSSVDLI